MIFSDLTQEQRRALPSNSQMKAGVAVNNVLQNHLADTIWKFGEKLLWRLQKIENCHSLFVQIVNFVVAVIEIDQIY